MVAPFVGAWIETYSPSAFLYDMSSLPSWERGLKHAMNVPEVIEKPVAPFVGAWIETPIPIPIVRGEWSLPSWERGLKPPVVININFNGCRSLRGSVD